MEQRCNFWLSKKRRFCANEPLKNSEFCGNHKPGSEESRIPCPIDPSHSILPENLDAHVKKCPLHKQVEALKMQSFYKKGINSGRDVPFVDRSITPHIEVADTIASRTSEMLGCAKCSESALYAKDCPESPNVSSEMKKKEIYEMSEQEFLSLLNKITSIHSSIASNIEDSYIVPESCSCWLSKQLDRQLPYQEKHVFQQASILGNLENFGILQRPKVTASVFPDHGTRESLNYDDLFEGRDEALAVVEFGAGRGYLTHMLTDCYGITKVVLIERRSYKLKADRSLRQKQHVTLDRLRIDIEDLDLNAVETLKGVSYLAIGKHLCGPATDFTLRCSLAQQHNRLGDNCSLRGVAVATCCHHLCQWKSYINQGFLFSMGISKEDFHAITWFTSWAVDADHQFDLSEATDQSLLFNTCDDGGQLGVEEILKNMKPVERAKLGFMCKDIIDIGRLMWIRENGFASHLVKYVPYNVSPENHLLVAKPTKQSTFLDLPRLLI
ncbi:hypothetical protein AMTRI_Chr02g266580 [Amborella trichopoda]